ncbi:MAG: RNA polymerase sigma factor [Chloroflexi bacterium]|nr:RNA polymerase sigma factor [Chloroflexota bacterium]MBI3761701.1 RNA polymerase sigma factor [Chloroflexota bacterium]
MTRVARSDPGGRALEALYQRYAATALGLSARILGDRASAEEILQEAFFRVWERSGSFDAARGPFAAWLFTITRRLCIDRLRQRQTRPQIIDLGERDDQPLMDLLPDPGGDVAESAQANSLRDKVRQALGTLPRDQCEVLLLSYFGGYTRREIAARLGQPEGTVHTRARLGLKKLRAALEELGIEPDDWG